MGYKKVVTAVALLPVLVLGLSSSLWADTRTASVRVSCTIVPMIELSSSPQWFNTALQAKENNSLGLSSKGQEVRVNTNLGKKYGMARSSAKAADGTLIKTYSVTAL